MSWFGRGSEAPCLFFLFISAMYQISGRIWNTQKHSATPGKKIVETKTLASLFFQPKRFKKNTREPPTWNLRQPFINGLFQWNDSKSLHGKWLFNQTSRKTWLFFSSRHTPTFPTCQKTQQQIILTTKATSLRLTEIHTHTLLPL